MMTLAGATPAVAASIEPVLITRVVALANGAPVFRSVPHPAAAFGEKILVIPLPRTAKGAFDLEKFQVSLKFSLQRTTNSCDLVTIQGALREEPLPETANLKILRLELRRNSLSTTLKACNDNRHISRAVPITTETIEPQPFTDNLVVYVPHDVKATAKIWIKARDVEGVEPQALTEDFEPSELSN